MEKILNNVWKLWQIIDQILDFKKTLKIVLEFYVFVYFLIISMC